MNLTEQKKIDLERITEARRIININLKNELITEMDIFNLAKVKNNYGFKEKNVVNTYRSNVLRIIYNCPFVLCDQNCLSLNIKQLLPLFLNYRYEMELAELEYQFNNGYLGLKEYEYMKKLKKFHYFESSNDGKNILKKGHVDNLSDNKIKTR